MSLKPFRIPETRLIVANDLVVQVTLTFRTDDDEELSYRYAHNSELQSLVQTAAVSLVNCGYINGVARGPGFVLHQMRKKWPIGKRYIFTRDGEPLQSSLHKYFFQLELIDDQQTAGQVPSLEIVELRGAPASPSASSMAGSVIEGLEALPLPPVAPVGYEEQFGEMAYDDGPGSPVREMRGGSDASMRGAPSPSPGLRYRQEVHDSEVAMDMSPRSAGRVRQFARHSPQQQMRAQFLPRQPQQPAHFSPQMSPRQRRSSSRASTVSMGESLSGRPPVPPEATKPITHGHAHQVKQQQHQHQQRPRLSHMGMYRSLHGISPLSRQPKSLSSDTEFMSALEDSFQGSSHGIPRGTQRLQDDSGAGTAGGEVLASKFKRKMLPPINLRRASRRRSSLSREMPLLETDSEVDTSDFTNIDPPTAPVAPAVAREGGLKVRMLAAPQSRIPTIASRNRGQSNASQRSRGSVGSHHQNTEDEDDGRASTVALTASVSTSSFRSAATATNAHRQMDNLLPHSPPTARQPRAAPTRAPTVSNVAAASGKSSAKRSLWSRLRAPLSGLVDKSPIKPSVRERIAAFNSMDHESAESSYAAVVRSQSLGNPYAFTRSHSKRSSQITPAGTRAESHTGGSTRTASPALSNTSMVSARVQEAINMFTGQTPDKDTGNGQPSRRRTSTSGGVKRAKPVDPNDDFVSPTKRQRARTQGDNYMASASGKSGRSLTASSGNGRLSHITLVQHMAQHYPHQ